MIKFGIYAALILLWGALRATERVFPEYKWVSTLINVFLGVLTYLLVFGWSPD